MTNQKGSISIHTENIFPIIKKWLYSDKDIFIRELISNGCDAVNKYKKLISLGEAKGNADENYKIKVSIDKENSEYLVMAASIDTIRITALTLSIKKASITCTILKLIMIK